ncbi:MAG TPA: hypothetical protein VMW27_15300 [Thermoanaerobaculia bacterium]|nr:hypothetical protein [Thermoanaerobaculia bacterium]
MRNRSILAALVCLFLFSLSPLAADSTIQRGIDIFTTEDNGRTSYDFAQTPIPAGFFCKGSKPFTGRVTFKGLPLITKTPGQLWGADTVIERLDDAVFDAKGTATTRIQFRALSLVSTAPIKTNCGSFHVYVSLDGEQRVTTMNIYRTQDAGGNFVAPLAVNTRVTFIPVKPARNKAARKLELATDFTFPATPVPWRFKSGARAKEMGPVIVDTNGDLTPDTLLPSPSNFSAGSSPDHFMSKVDSYYYTCDPCAFESCHTDPSSGKQHCSYPMWGPGCGIRDLCP